MTDFKFAKISDSPTKEEIDEEIKRLSRVRAEHKDRDAALKVIINSAYGVCGYPGFICYDRDVAHSITKQSEHLIKYTIDICNEFFKEHWHKATKIHEKMGIKGEVPKIDEEVVLYSDTDSIFVSMKKAYESVDYDGNFIEFVIDLDESGFNEWLHERLDEYVANHNGFMEKATGEKALILELEQICKTVLWTGKKQYIKNPIWDEGTELESLEKIEPKGIELARPTSALLLRDRLEEIVKYLMAEGGKVTEEELARKLQSVKDRFKNPTNIEDVCNARTIKKYDNFVNNDCTKDGGVDLKKGIPGHYLGAVWHNNLLKRKPELLRKYELIKSGDRVHYYHCEGKPITYFAFKAGQFPIEIAPPMDSNTQFEKVFLSPVNRIVKALGMREMTANLSPDKALW